MRRFDAPCIDPEFPCRFCLDEPRFSGGREALRNEEVTIREPTAAERG